MNDLKKKKKRQTSPYAFVINSFLGVIIVSTLLLLLPFSTKDGNGLSLIDAIFTSTSAVCVTGLSVIPNVGDTLTVFGKIVLAIVIEIGGLGFVTIAIFIVALLGVRIGIKERFLLKEALNQENAQGMIKLVLTIVVMTICIQSLGAIINMFVFTKYYPFWKALGISIFHAISSFNNAGFDIFGSGVVINGIETGSNSMLAFSNNLLLNFNTCFLIILGGIGFIVLMELRKKKWKKFNLHTKIVLTTTLWLLIIGTLLLRLLMAKVDGFGWLQAFFLSVSTRTAGFMTFPISKLSNEAYFLTILLMFIGASPCSTGGGIKTVTLFVLIRSIIGIAKGKPITAYNRTINQQSVIKAFGLITFALTFVATMLVILLVIEPETYVIDGVEIDSFRCLLFETFSAFGTVGLSVGITSSLTTGGKIIICLLMFFGRLGPLTFMNIWNKHWLNDVKSDISYVTESVIIG